MDRSSMSGEVELLAWLPPCQEDSDFGTREREQQYAAQLRAEGYRSAIWMYESNASSTVRALHRQIGLEVNPLVPNMRSYLRDASEFGVVGAALQRFRRLPLADKVLVAAHNIHRPIGVVKRDFATGVLIMVDMEATRFRKLGASKFLLNASVTDLVLALDAPHLIREFIRLAERNYGVEAGLATYNYGVLVERLRSWKIHPGLITAPFNPKGYLMNPSMETCEETVLSSRIPVLATHVDVDGLVERDQAVSYLRNLGIDRALVSRSPLRDGSAKT